MKWANMAIKKTTPPVKRRSIIKVVELKIHQFLSIVVLGVGLNLTRNLFNSAQLKPIPSISKLPVVIANVTLGAIDFSLLSLLMMPSIGGCPAS
jgi:energy-converting hydrogenase Eha subunit H